MEMNNINDINVVAALYANAEKELSACGIDLNEVKSRLARQVIEVPSWGFSRGGTRFGRYVDGSEARTVKEKLEDAGVVHALTGVTPTVSLHFPWDGGNDEDYARIPGYL